MWERLKARREGDDRDEMVGWHHPLNGHELEQAPGNVEHSRQYCCGLPFPFPWIELVFPTLQADSLPSEPPGKPHCYDMTTHPYISS